MSWGQKPWVSFFEGTPQWNFDLFWVCDWTRIILLLGTCFQNISIISILSPSLSLSPSNKKYGLSKSTLLIQDWGHFSSTHYCFKAGTLSQLSLFCQKKRLPYVILKTVLTTFHPSTHIENTFDRNLNVHLFNSQ